MPLIVIKSFKQHYVKFCSELKVKLNGCVIIGASLGKRSFNLHTLSNVWP